MTLKHLVIAAVCTMSGIVASQSYASRGIRAENPGFQCFAPDWSPIVFDPYSTFDGNSDESQNPSTFFSPGTVVTQAAVFCAPTIVFSTTAPSQGDSANPASKPDSNGAPTVAALTATGGVMYEWINATDTELAPDAEVIVWTLPSSTILPDGALELELDNWCGNNDDGNGTAPPPSAVPSFTWNGNRYDYYLKCANFNGDDLLLNSSGLVIGYVDDSTNDFNNTITTNTAPGWQVAYATTTRLGVSPASPVVGEAVTFHASVSGIPGSTKPAGTVTFFNGTSPLGAAKVDGVGYATFKTSALAVGTYSITAAFTTSTTGNANYAANSVSSPLSLKIAK